MERTKQNVMNLLRELPFFDSFDDGDLQYFAPNLSLRRVPAGTLLFNEGDMGNYLLFIVEGVMEIILSGENRLQKIVATYGPGASIGEMALIDEYERSAAVRAATDCEILILTKSKFDAMQQENQPVAMKVIKGLARNISLRLRATQGRFRDII